MHLRCAPSPFGLSPQGEASVLSPSAEEEFPFKYLCKPDIVYILNRGHGLHFCSLSSMPVFRWCNLFGSLVEYTEQMKTIPDLPLLFVYSRESQRDLT